MTVNELVAKFFSDDEIEGIMVGKCDACSILQLSIDSFNAESTSENDSSSPSENETLDEHSIAYYECVRGQDNRLTKILFK